MTTLENEIDFSDAETFKSPSDGNHKAYLQRVEFGLNQAGTREQWMLTFQIAPDDPDSPNAQLRYWLGWPDVDDKEIMWGNRSAFGAKVQAIKECLTAFGGQESGKMTKDGISAFLSSKEGQAVMVKVKNTLRKAREGEELDPEDPANIMANIQKITPAT